MIVKLERRAGLIASAVVTLILFSAPSGAEVQASYQQFTSQNFGGDRAPTWSPDGASVYYSTRLAGFPYIYKKASNAPMNATGTRLTAWEIEEYAVAASPDGGWVVIAAQDTLGATRLWRCPATGGAPLTIMVKGPFDYIDPHWWGSGPSQEIAFSTTRGGAGYQIWTVKPNGTQLATQFAAVTDAGHIDLHPCFSPDGNTIVFSSNRSGGWQLFACTRSGNGWGAPVQLTSGGGDKAKPSYSPTGLTIAYEQSDGETSLWIVDANGANPRAVTDGSGDYDGNPSWSPSTSQMAFVSNRSGATYIWLINDVSTAAEGSTWGRLKAQYRQ